MNAVPNAGFLSDFFRHLYHPHRHTVPAQFYSYLGAKLEGMKAKNDITEQAQGHTKFKQHSASEHIPGGGFHLQEVASSAGTRSALAYSTSHHSSLSDKSPIFVVAGP